MEPLRGKQGRYKKIDALTKRYLPPPVVRNCTAGDVFGYVPVRFTSKKKQPFAYGVSSGPVIITRRRSSLSLITRQKQLEPYSTGSAVLYAVNSLKSCLVFNVDGAFGTFFKK